jgi:ribosomal protein S18 acetylase RimI-like enzyme
MTRAIALRTATEADLPFLWDMLFESAFTTDEQRAAWRRDPIHPPELRKYLDAYPRPGDASFIAIDNTTGDPAGAAWYRVFTPAERGDGILAHPNVPELAIAVAPAHRQRGIGVMLMRALIDAATAAGHAMLTLSVDPRNAAALALYARVGFARMETDDPAAGTSWIMTVALAR